MDLRWAGMACLMATMLAGCSGDAGSNDDDGGIPREAFDDLDLESTATTGIIRGIVVDEAIRPLEGAHVSLTVPGRPAEKADTTAAGSFGFDNLEPGTYFVKVSKPTYASAQQSVEVVAGVDDPVPVRVLLQSDGSVAPYWTDAAYEGFIECTTSILLLCGAPNLVSELILCGEFDVCIGNITQDRAYWNQYFPANATMIQSEMMWESTQSISEELYFEMEALEAGCEGGSFYNSTEGPSPIFTQVFQDELQDRNFGPDCPIYYSLFSGGTVGFTVEQDYTMYMHAFYGYEPPEGWRFVADGTPPPAPT